VHVIYGGSPGLVAAGNQLWSQNSPGIADAAEIVDFFGRSLAAGNFGKSSHADLAIGAPIETLGAADATGVVHVLYGSATGIQAGGDQLWHQNSTGILGTNGDGDTFGWTLAAGNYGKTSQVDLAIGVPSDLVGGVAAGAVNVLYGTSTGLSQAGDQLWHQDSVGIFGVAEAGDNFGNALG
jgi:disulfide bond formation protein DsbB